jgi:hypothetical protein
MPESFWLIFQNHGGGRTKTPNAIIVVHLQDWINKVSDFLAELKPIKLYMYVQQVIHLSYHHDRNFSPICHLEVVKLAASVPS